ncbi:MerR family transcriptional regulator [Alicyclobacillus dauci]|uniref:MerR family transcriptional regulator n=1 Tax=Alicyclobacillus dauci TaxID=1475485 RepID=A0ABY6Z498_9BACL|nr:MerR family transcriptional regulator [Alicyclobacillus dauci]WAH37468.1 MerR family transcriptional regulator [Alicyclobacillus dauci]
MEQAFTIQEIAAITGLSVHTLRYYERIGLLDPVSRTENGYRSYSAKDIAWVEFLNRLRVTGMPIRTMQEFASLRRKGDATVRERRELLEQHETNIRAHMAELEQNLRQIEKKIDLYKEMEEKHDTQDRTFSF